MYSKNISEQIYNVYTTARQSGFTINVLSDYDQKMDRFAFLMVH